MRDDKDKPSFFEPTFGLVDYSMFVWLGLVVAIGIIAPIWLISELRMIGG